MRSSRQPNAESAPVGSNPGRQDLLGVKDGQTVIDRELLRDGIDGVFVEVLRPVVTRNSVTTEFLSSYWGGCSAARHAILVTFRPGAVAAWHMHRGRKDYVMVHSGHVLVVMYDGRAASATLGKVQVAHLSEAVPTLVTIPPGVWHGIQNLQALTPSGMINYFDQPYDPSDPDSWRLPPNTDEIPYSFRTTV